VGFDQDKIKRFFYLQNVTFLIYYNSDLAPRLKFHHISHIKK